MALRYTIDAQQKLIIISGEYADAGEWKTLLSRVFHDPSFGPGFAFLRDLRHATSPVDASTVVQIMEAVSRFWPILQPSRAAILTPLELDPAALTAQALADTHALPIRVFRSYEIAIAWLTD